MTTQACGYRIVMAALVLMAVSCSQNRKAATTSGIQSNLAASSNLQLAAMPGNRQLSPLEAASLAAKLANKECERLYRQQPFKPEQWNAVLTENKYQWGELDVGGPGGFSAQVTFDADGEHPHVEIYLSRDFPVMLLRRR